jgi:hypothetical protein
MIEQNSSAFAARALIDARLSALVSQRQRGIDISPAQLHRFEGYLSACMDMDAEIQAEQLVAICRQSLPTNCTLEFDAVRDEFTLTMPQMRAPVYPSTND